MRKPLKIDVDAEMEKPKVGIIATVLTIFQVRQTLYLIATDPRRHGRGSDIQSLYSVSCMPVEIPTHRTRKELEGTESQETEPVEGSTMASSSIFAVSLYSMSWLLDRSAKGSCFYHCGLGNLWPDHCPREPSGGSSAIRGAANLKHPIFAYHTARTFLKSLASWK